MAVKFLKTRRQRVLFRVVVSTLAIICIIGVAINFYFSPKLDQKLKNTILTSTDSLYSLNFSKANLHVLQGKIVIDNIVLQPNLDVYNRRKKVNLAPNSLYEVKIRRLVINHIHPFKLYFDRKLDIDQLVISEPDLIVNYEQNRDQDTVIKDKKTPYQLISKVLKSIHIENILLNDVKLKYVNRNGDKPDAMEFKELNLSATDFLLDSTSQFSKTRFLFCEDVGAELNNYNGTSDDKRYAYQVKKVRFSTRSSELNISGMSFLPTESANTFFKNSQSDYYSIKLDSLRLDHFDFKSYSKYHKLFASNLKLSDGSIHIYANPNPKDTTSDNSVNFPQLLLKRFKIDLKIDTIGIKNISLIYTEYNKKSGKTGTVSFDNTSGELLNITNNKAALQKNNMATVQLKTYFINTARLDVQFSFKLDDENMPFSYKGHLAPMDLQKITPVTTPLAMVKISSGKLKSFDFDFKADRVKSTGKVVILYNDLRVAVLKRDENDNLKKMSIASLLANALVIKRDNPAENGPPRVGEVLWVRKINSSIFTYMWKTLLMGIKESAGYDKQTEQTVKQKVIEFKQNKLTHDARKALRQQKRAARREKRAQKKAAKEAAEVEKSMEIE